MRAANAAQIWTADQKHACHCLRIVLSQATVLPPVGRLMTAVAKDTPVVAKSWTQQAVLKRKFVGRPLFAHHAPSTELLSVAVISSAAKSNTGVPEQAMPVCSHVMALVTPPVAMDLNVQPTWVRAVLSVTSTSSAHQETLRIAAAQHSLANLSK